MLHRWSDLQPLAYLVAYPSLMAYQWFNGFHAVLFGIMLVLSVGLSVAQHHHTHLRIWKSKFMNRLTDWLFSIVQGVPSFVFFPSHIGNHHKHTHGPEDETRTYRFGGHHNHIIGYLLHPFQALTVLVPSLLRYIPRRAKKGDHWPWIELASIVVVSTTLALIDVRAWLLLVALPQAHGLHWLLASNYLQHAGARPGTGPEASEMAPNDASRNFTGLVNLVWLNIGYHNAHHLEPRTHWADMPAVHRREVENIPLWLVERSLILYFVRTLLFQSRRRQRNFMEESKR
ncbi:MAG TPA: fatty acid desaturase [Candidatus Poseidoniales archaeon]|nr:MAG TPA: fatty acid desaturase [Candidatus Poseidoniales archaeon]|tara:strand:+ start:8144 stop:9004 length:861 start_codon:yes stop_codon:yes gene_type:complete